MTRKHHKLIDADSVYNALQRAEDAKRYVDNDSILLAASQIKDILLNPDLSKWEVTVSKDKSLTNEQKDFISKTEGIINDMISHLAFIRNTAELINISSLPHWRKNELIKEFQFALKELEVYPELISYEQSKVILHPKFLMQDNPTRMKEHDDKVNDLVAEEMWLYQGFLETHKGRKNIS